MSEILDFVRGLVRPVVTVGLVSAAVAAVFTGRLDAEWLAGAGSVVLGFWFVSRENGKA